MVVLDGVGKDFGFDLQSSLLTLGRAGTSSALLSLNRNLLAFALGVLLSAKDNGLWAVYLVDFIHGFVHMEQGTGTCSTF